MYIRYCQRYHQITSNRVRFNSKPDPTVLLLVGLGRIELPTSRLSGVRSNHLSYRPDGLMATELVY